MEIYCSQKKERRKELGKPQRGNPCTGKKRPLYAVLHFGRAIKNYARQKYILNTGKSLPDAARKYTQAAAKGKRSEREGARQSARECVARFAAAVAAAAD